MKYTVSYDLLRPGKDYTSLYNELERLGARRILLSEWVLRRDQTSAVALRDHLRQFMDANDRIMVAALDRADDWAGFNLMFDPNKT